MALNFDLVVIGGGHAGCEAAHAGAKLGLNTLLLAVNLDTIGAMPCNPAVGGPGKSHLVKELDSLGGVMGLAADATYLQMRMLNMSRGPAVQSLRAQSDKREYSGWMKRFMESLPNLTLRQGMVKELLIENGSVAGVKLAFGDEIKAKAVVLSAGTFLEGTIWIGRETMPAGRAGEFPALGLSAFLKALGFQMGRLKTGTPPRIDGRTINYADLLIVPGDENPQYFSFLDDRPRREQLPCHQTRTTARTHEVIRNNLHESPMYSGMIHGVGPRYCPSIEDKVVRFADKESHALFLEPEGRSTYEVYLQGCSTSLPAAVQHQIVKSLPGLEEAVIIRSAYAVEYDYLPAVQFDHCLMAKELKGFFAAGQMLGTSGYEEAAAQGIIAGINAARYIRGEEPFTLSRSSSYIGTLIDDLVTKEIAEPYRMMTSRSEYRLLLRQDNADARLTSLGRSIGLVDDRRWAIFQAKYDAIERERKRLAETRIHPCSTWDEALAPYEEKIKQAVTLEELLRRPRIPYSVIEKIAPANEGVEFAWALEVETEIKYAGYIERQKNQVAQTEKLDGVRLPADTDYALLENLSKEAREKLNRIRPETLGQAARIAGVSPADVSVLLVNLEIRRRQQSAQRPGAQIAEPEKALC
ncbi:MAG: tRNA uridine-5-carboxymethylaminomethyl(34) synthesis enzyme MnmG [Candidatus Melainabacteria bacterium]|nr:MAG: tRNA uridine-5-carboxymethylaminomethyl(34) synthesis enzyme MnmG [Candidatus Melainabacteria bacterium]